MHLIGVNGFKRSGKGTVANIVADRAYASPTTVAQVGFADKLKILGARTLGFTDLSDAECIALMDEAKESWAISVAKNVTVHDGPKHSPGRLSPGWVTTEPVTLLTGREYLQNIGNEARQIFGDTFWIDMVLPDPVAVEGWPSERATLLERHYPNLDVLLITDLRYQNEAERVKALGGVVWEVLRPGTNSDGHASEIPLPRELVDYQINNDGSLSDLESAVEEALNQTC